MAKNKKKTQQEESGVWSSVKGAGRAVGKTTGQIYGFAANATPLTATIVAGGLAFLLGRSSGSKIKLS